jgi:hypothetical protein
VRRPAEPQAVVHAPVAPGTQAKPLSRAPSQSSSRPLHTSGGARHPVGIPAASQSVVPIEPQVVAQGAMAEQQPSSVRPSQLSSRPLHVSAGAAQAPQAQAPLHTREPVEPHAVVHDPVAPATQARPLSATPSQLSSRPLHTSAGGTHAPCAHAALQARDPVEPQAVVHAAALPWAQAKPSSIIPSQSSSRPLHASAGAAQAPSAQSPSQARVPAVPHGVVHATVPPRTHAKPLSAAPSQSSSRPLQVSAGGRQPVGSPAALQIVVPIVPQEVAQGVLVEQQPSSTRPSQLSSRPLHISGGGTHASQAQVALHMRWPADPQAVMQVPIEPAMQAKPLSIIPSQSSSRRLHASAGGRQPLGLPAASQVVVPIEPQLAVHAVAAEQQPSSVRPSQLSSRPLHTSIGGTHAPRVQASLQVWVPGVPQEVVQAPTLPRAQVKPLSTAPSQLSSRPLQVSGPGMHAPGVPIAVQVVVPMEPQVVVQGIALGQQPSSAAPSQLSSTPLPQTSITPGWRAASVSAQSSPPQARSPWPSPSRSRAACWQPPRALLQVSAVHSFESSQLMGERKPQPSSGWQRHEPLHGVVAQSASTAQRSGGRGRQPTAARQISPPAQRSACGVFWQTRASLHESRVQRMPSEHSALVAHVRGGRPQPKLVMHWSPSGQQSVQGSWAQEPARQRSTVHAMKSSQERSVVQGAAPSMGVPSSPASAT